MDWKATGYRLVASFLSEGRARMKIAIQGELGSFSHEAALKLVPDATIVPYIAFGGRVCGAG